MKPLKKLVGETDPSPAALMAFLSALIIVGIYGAYHIIVRQETAPIAGGLLVPSYVFFEGLT